MKSNEYPIEVTHERRGFALVVTLTVMVLLVLVGLGMLSLSTIATRTISSGNEMQIARENARVALMIAMADLQKFAGPDTRVTAPANAVAGSGSNTTPYVTGVWRSWEGKDHDQSNGLPSAPNYASKLADGDFEIDSSEDGRFLGWLVSGTEQSNGATDPPTVDKAANTVPLLAEGTLGSGTDKEVHLVPTEIGDDGAYAWWIEGENTKAYMADKGDEPSTVAEWSQNLASNGQPDVEEFGFSDPDELATVPTRKSLDLASNTVTTVEGVSGTNFHEITPFARGLLTNTATGGWRRDLSLMSEQWDSLQSPAGSSTSFPFFTLSPGKETAALKNTGAVGGLIYPWASESLFSAENGAKKGGASVGWGALKDFALSYQDVSPGASSGSAKVQAQEAANSEGKGFGRDELAIRPILARIHWVFSFQSTVDPKNPARYKAALNAVPVVTYWNPYNVSIPGFTSFWLRLGSHFPYKFKFKVGSVEQNDFYPLYYQMGNAVNLTFIMPNDTADWQPGETRTYSPSNFSKFSRFQMKRGYLSPFGTSAAILANGKSGTQLSGTATDPITVSIKAISDSDFTLETLQWNGTITNNVAHSYLVPANDITRFWPPETVQNTTQTMGNLAAGGPSPFLTAMLQLQNIYTYSAGSRGYTHRKPITGILSANIQGKSAPAGHLDALPFDWVFRYPNGSSGIGTDSGLPVDNIDESDPDGFIGTSYRFEDGLTSMVAAELPRMPLRSLGELQHFDVGYYSPMAPYVAEPIGNSNASFLIAPDEVYINDGYGTAERVSYDHSYVGNHLFFDDWFVSSIAPETSGTSSSAIRSMEEVYSDFLSVAEPLPNRSYLPAKPLSDSEAAAAASDLVADKTAWHSVASNIEVEGMFNVNSTSVEAWTALLKHLKEAEVPYVSGSSVVLESGVDHPVSRTTVAGDPAAQAEVYSTVGCHKRLTDKQIEALATEIVEQVKKRGPFLSLSEFVNRRLTSSDTELALSGAVEAALSELATRGADENPFADLQATFTENVSVPSGGSYEFPEATQGNLAYGFPGWIRQADVLRPLAPVLSARDDTFVIRAYGESRSTNGDVNARAWCEAVVQRKADYVDEADEPSVMPSDTTLTSEANKVFGRGFSIVSFRWLSPDEV